MSAMDISNTDEPTHSEADLALIGFLAIWHQMPYLSAHRLIQLNSKTWPVWCLHNIKRISEARREDDTRDWYFPVFFRSTSTESNTRSPWCGIHHSSAAEIQARPRSLPPLTSLTPPSPHISFVACSGGLLLIRLPPCICTRTSNLQSKWERLVVCNPLRKEWRELPAADCGDLGLSLWDFHHVQLHMEVYDAANSYKVILTSINFVCVYKSTSNSWVCKRFPTPGLWGPFHRMNRILPWGYVSASTYMAGRLYLADIGVDRFANAPSVRVFEINEEAATWQLHKKYTLRPRGFRQGTSIFRNERSSIQINKCLELVECMGDMYVIIAAASAPATSIVKIDELELMPLQFHVFQLRGDGHAHGIMSLQLPHAAGDIQVRINSISARFLREDFWFYRNWFRCTASGSMIWVSFEDYLLNYDVGTRQSKTQILTVPETSQFDCVAQFSYRPSFHMKP